MTASRKTGSGRQLFIRNRQRDCRINGQQLRRLIRHHLDRQLAVARYHLTVHLVSASRMARMNEEHLNHSGPTDVLTFDYADPGDGALAGELVVCPAVAVEQARTFGTSWEAEVIRYIVHGILHLRGHDDLAPAARRRMKRVEDRLLAALLTEQDARMIRL